MKHIKILLTTFLILITGQAQTMKTCLLYTSDAADERSSVDLGGRRIIKKKNEYYIRVRLSDALKKKMQDKK